MYEWPLLQQQMSSLGNSGSFQQSLRTSNIIRRHTVIWFLNGDNHIIFLVVFLTHMNGDCIGFCLNKTNLIPWCMRGVKDHDNFCWIYKLIKNILLEIKWPQFILYSSSTCCDHYNRKSYIFDHNQMMGQCRTNVGRSGRVSGTGVCWLCLK